MSTNKDWMVKAVAVMFGMPMAFNVLAKLDDRLDFVPLLERIVLGFDSVSRAVWQLVSAYIDYNLTSFHSLLTFLLILVSTIIANKVGTGLYGEPAKVPVPTNPLDIEAIKAWRVSNAEQIFYSISTLVFIVMYLRFSGLEKLLLPMILVGYFTAKIIEVSTTIISMKLPRTLLIRGFSAIVLIAALLIILIYGAFYNSTVERATNPLFVGIGPSLVFVFTLIVTLLTYFASDQCRRAISYGGLWVFGILLLNWIALKGRPSLEKLLDSIGA